MHPMMTIPTVQASNDNGCILPPIKPTLALPPIKTRPLPLSPIRAQPSKITVISGGSNHSAKSVDDEDEERARRRRLRRPSRYRRHTSEGARFSRPAPLKGVLRKTSSFGNLADQPKLKKRVSFSGIESSCRWNSNGSLSKNMDHLVSPRMIRSLRGQTTGTCNGTPMPGRQLNQKWNSRKNAAPVAPRSLDADELSDDSDNSFHMDSIRQAPPQQEQQPQQAPRRPLRRGSGDASQSSANIPRQPSRRGSLLGDSQSSVNIPRMPSRRGSDNVFEASVSEFQSSIISAASGSSGFFP